MATIFGNFFSGTKTQNGEITINLNLTIKIDADGSLRVVPTVGDQPQPEKTTTPAVEVGKTKYEIPDLDLGVGDLIDFGKSV